MSIQASDLRVGNIFWEDYGGYKVVTGINCNMVGEAKNTVMGRAIKGTTSGSFGCDNIEAVPLTPEILIKSGFTQSDVEKNFFYAQLKDKTFGVDIKTKYAELETVHHSMQIPAYPEHLHQLQNLYFSLTNEELTINL